MQNNGYLVISLDFELLWGVFDVVERDQKTEYFKNTREVIPTILKNFTENKIHATWAVVGMLFNKDWQEWKKNQPELLPEYVNSRLSAYKFGNTIETGNSEELFFAPDLIEKIKQAEGQEIATHTYSHYYCLEPGQNIDQFRSDLKKAIEVACAKGIEITSLVFPRNQLKPEYLEICAELGITSVRTNPSSWYWKDTLSEAFVTKLARSGDAYFPLGKKCYSFSEIQKKETYPLEQKASRFLRPVEGNGVLRKLKMNRVKREMEKAAKNKEVYHLWWHPHNFGDNPQESLKDLTEILHWFSDCRERYGFQSLNMRELYEKT